MKKAIIFLVIIISVFPNSFGQTNGNKFGIDATINYAFLGDGDFGAIYYDNNFSYPLFHFVDLTGSIGFLISSNSGVNDVFLSHTDAYLMGDFIIRIIPIKGKRISASFGLGYSNRFRSETRVQSVLIINGEVDSKFNHITSFDNGYMGQVSLNYMLNKNVGLLIIGELHSYNKGSGISSIGIGFNYKF